MGIRERLIHFQNNAERKFNERKSFINIVRYISAFVVFMASTLIAGLTLPLRLIIKALNRNSEHKIQHMNKKNIESIMNKEQLVLVDFWAEWCGPCMMMSPVIEEFATTNKEVCVVKVNADTNSEIVGKFKIKGLPQFLLFQNGKEIKRHAGPMTRPDLVKFCSLDR